MEPELPLEAALRVKSAELWLQVGQPLQALSELQRLPMESQNHPWAVEVARSICRAVYCREDAPATGLPPDTEPSDGDTPERNSLTAPNLAVSLPA